MLEKFVFHLQTSLGGKFIFIKHSKAISGALGETEHITKRLLKSRNCGA